VLHFEGKIWRTLPMLAWRPGELTRRYIEGERARFVSPMALFLFSVFLMFAIFSAIGGPFALHGPPQASAQAQAEARRDFDAERAAALQALDGLRAERARRAAQGQATAEIDRRIQSAALHLQLRDEAFRQAMNLVAPGPQAAAAPPAAQDNGGLNVRLSEQPGSIAWLNQAWLRAKQNPSLLIYKLETNAYKFSWALIPISVPFLWLLFLHRRRYRRFKAYDHVVFVTYSIAAMSLGLVVLSLLRPLGIGSTFIGLAIVLVPPIHIYRQLRGAYSLSRFSALWRTAALLVFACVAAMIFFLLLLTLGLLG